MLCSLSAIRCWGTETRWTRKSNEGSLKLSIWCTISLLVWNRSFHRQLTTELNWFVWTAGAQATQPGPTCRHFMTDTAQCLFMKATIQLWHNRHWAISRRKSPKYKKESRQKVFLRTWTTWISSVQRSTKVQPFRSSIASNSLNELSQSEQPTWSVMSWPSSRISQLRKR